MPNELCVTTADETTSVEYLLGQYEPPAIEERTKIGVPLAIVTSTGA